MKKIFALALLMCLFALPALAAEPVSYVECSWDETTDSVVKTVKQVTEYSNLVSSSNMNLTDGWYVVKGNVTVNGEIRVSGTVNLILTDGCELTATRAIQANDGGRLNIYAQSDIPGEMGKLNAQEGIRVFVGRELYIHGSEVGATGLDDRSAGIGVGDIDGWFAGVVTIYDGVVTATGGYRSAGIGGGNKGGSADAGNGGKVTIYGGTVTATGGGSGAGIGGGYGRTSDPNDNSGNGGTVNIHGGTVTAKGGSSGAGIGGGFRGNGAAVTITGGSVKAIGGNSASDIGGGYNGSEGSLKNAAGKALTKYTLTITGADNGTPVQGLFGKGYVPYDYCANDMITQDTNKLYLYLPSGEEQNIQFLSTAAGIYTVTWSGTTGTAALGEHTHNDDGAVTYELLTQARHVKLTACKDCPTAYVKRETEVHTYDRCDSDGATLTGLCACGYEIGKATVSVQGGVYNGGPYTAEVDKTGLFAGQEFAITYTRDSEEINETPALAGSYTASITKDGVTASADFEIAKAESAVTTAPTANTLTYTGGQQALVKKGEATSGGTLVYSQDQETWSDELPTGSAVGEYTVYYKVQGDRNHNDSGVCGPIHVTIDYLSDEQAPDAEPSGKLFESDCYTEQPTLNAQEGTEVSLNDDPNGHWAESLPLPTEDGTHTYTYYVKMENGTIAKKSVTLTVDTTAPEVAEPTVLADPTSAVITVTATDAGSGVMDIGFKVNSGEGELVIEGNGDGSYTITGLIPGETYSITLIVRDYMGHETRVDITITAPLPPALPQTGDHSRAALWLSLLTMAGAGMMLLRRKAEQ